MKLKLLLPLLFLLPQVALAQAPSSLVSIPQTDLSSLVQALKSLNSFLSTGFQPKSAAPAAPVVPPVNYVSPKSSSSSASTDGLSDSVRRVSATLGARIDNIFSSASFSGETSFSGRTSIMGMPIFTSGTDNFFIGDSTGNQTLTGDINLAVGYRSMTVITTGRQNIALGSDILSANTTGNYNVGIGGFALNHNTSGQLNVAVGIQALEENTTGGSNTAVGDGALPDNTTGGNNTAIGRHTLLVSTTGNSNVAIGMQALIANTTGSSNIAIGGAGAGSTNTTGSHNTIIGAGADVASGDLSYAAAFGESSVVSASNAMVLGGVSGGTGEVNVGIGTTSPWAKLSIVARNQSLAVPLFTIASSSSALATTTSFIITGAGNVGIGTTSPSQQLTVSGSVGFPGIANGAGTAYLCQTLATGVVSTSTSACNPSSIRFKENVADLTYGLDTIRQLRPVSYDYKPELLVPGHQIGFIAEEVDPLIPEIVGKDASSTPSNIDYAKLAPVLVKAIQELDQRVSSSTQTISDSSGLLDNLAFVGGSIVDGAIHFVELVVDHVKATLVSTENLEIKDSATGEWYCVRITNGEWDKQPGTCESLAAPILPPQDLPEEPEEGSELPPENPYLSHKSALPQGLQLDYGWV